MAKTFDQYLAESGRQSELDTLRKEGKYDRAKSEYESSGSYGGLNPYPTPTQQPSSPGKRLSLAGGKDYGGWYDNPATGRNQRYFGVDASGKEIWTDGEEPGRPSNAQEVTPYLNNYQNNIFNDTGAPQVKVPTMEELKSQLQPESGLPALLNRAEMFEEYRTQYGVADLETALNDLKAQEDDEVAAFRQQRFTEEGKPVATNVIAGRVSEEERAANERLDFIGRQKSRVVDELNTKYTVIGQMMEFAGLDYQDAVDRYQTEFDRNLKMYDIISGKEKEARSAFESDRDAARANLQIYMNAITSGNIDYGSLSGDQKAMVAKLEVQSGLPVGFMSSVKKDPNSDIIFTTSNEGVTQVGIRNADGSIDVQSYGTRIGGSSSEKKVSDVEYRRNAQSEMTNFLTGKTNSYGHVDPQTYNYARNKWIGAGQDPDDFDSIYRTFRDPYRTDNAYNVREED